MPVEIDQLETHVNVTPGASSRPGGAAPTPLAATAAGSEALIEALRPVVRQLLREELELAMRARGLR